MRTPCLAGPLHIWQVPHAWQAEFPISGQWGLCPWASSAPGATPSIKKEEGSPCLADINGAAADTEEAIMP